MHCCNGGEYSGINIPNTLSLISFPHFPDVVYPYVVTCSRNLRSSFLSHQATSDHPATHTKWAWSHRLLSPSPVATPSVSQSRCAEARNKRRKPMTTGVTPQSPRGCCDWQLLATSDATILCGACHRSSPIRRVTTTHLLSGGVASRATTAVADSVVGLVVDGHG